MSHNHSHEPLNYNRAFAIGLILNAGFVIVEVIYGFLTNSLALVADAGHNLSDVLGLVLAWGASFLSQRPPTQRYTYGFRRSSILAALFNAIILLLVMGGVAWEAIRRFSNPSPIPGGVVIGVAIAGVIINTITALMFLSGRKRDINIRGAFLHMSADAMVSLGVVLAGVAILTTGWLWFDPAISLIVVIVVVVNSWQLLRESLNLALDAVPTGIEPLAVRTYLSERPGVTEVHDLHIWAMSASETALSVHLVIPQGHPGDAFLARVTQELHDVFGIEHATIQIEIGDPNNPCVLAPHHLV